MTGKVKWFNDAKGFGYLTAPGRDDIFCHWTNIAGEGYKSLKPGDTVKFDIYETDKGYQALNIVKES